MYSARECAVDILNNVFYRNAYSNIELNNKLKKTNFNEKDKALITEIVYGTIKYKYSLDSIISAFLHSGLKDVDQDLVNILRITIYQLRYLDKIPDFAAVNEAVEISKKISKGSSKFINGVLRNYLRSKDKYFYSVENEFDRLCFTYSFPHWMISLFIDQYGKNTAISILEGLNSSPPVTVRVNTLKATFDEVWNKLVSLGYEVEEGNISPDAIRIINGKGIENNPLFNEGLMTVQDESAMMVAPLMELSENLTVIDLCSAPGGKTTHISEIMNNTGKVLAFDIYKNKLEMIRRSSERLGIRNIILNTIDASVLDEKLIDSADRVLIDVPCSGLGIIRKKPEIKWNKQYKDIQDIMHIQRKIMSNAKRYVKPGGIMIYSTCTLAKEENEENIDWFLKNNPSFKIIPIECGKSENLLYNENGSLTILPNDKMDGFFISKFMRQL